MRMRQVRMQDVIKKTRMRLRLQSRRRTTKTSNWTVTFDSPRPWVSVCLHRTARCLGRPQSQRACPLRGALSLHQPGPPNSMDGPMRSSSSRWEPHPQGRTSCFNISEWSWWKKASFPVRIKWFYFPINLAKLSGFKGLFDSEASSSSFKIVYQWLL